MVKTIEGDMSKGQGRYAVVVAKFNRTITQRLHDGAIEALKQHGVADDDITVVWAPGAFELPTIASRLASTDQYDAIICLGAVIKGETSHDQHINRAISMLFAELGVEYDMPVIFGVLTTNNVEQAEARAGIGENIKDKALPEGKVSNKGSEAAEAALEMVALLRDIDG